MTGIVHQQYLCYKVLSVGRDIPSRVSEWWAGRQILPGIRNCFAPGIKDFCIWQFRLKSRMAINNEFDIFAILRVGFYNLVIKLTITITQREPDKVSSLCPG